MTSNGTRPQRQTFVEVARGPLAVGLPVGAAVGALVGGVVRDNLVAGLVLGPVVALVVVALLVAADIRAGAMGVPHRRPFRPGDRFMGWTVAGRLRTGLDHTVEYEVRHGDDRGRLTVLSSAHRDPHRPALRVPHPLAEIRSACLTQPVAVGAVGDVEYVVTELDRGEPLAARIPRRGPMSDADLFLVAAGTAMALREVHAHGAAHGRVWPDQVEVGAARVALLAFDALASYRDRDAYLAPEQTSGVDAATAAGDVFSWACTVCFAATGHPPFATRPGETGPDLASCPAWLRPVLIAALADDPAARPGAAQLVERLRVVGRELGWQVSRPDPPRQPAKPLARMRTRTAVAVAASVVLAAVLPFVVPEGPGGTADASPGGTPLEPVPTELTTAPVGTTPAPASGAPPVTTTATTAAGGAEWPAGANEGSPAFNAYLGASFLVPDWVSCAGGHCIVGAGDLVYLFTEKPVREVAYTDLEVDDPAAALTGMGLDPAEANELLTR